MISAQDIINLLSVDFAGGTLSAVEGAGALPAAWDQVRASRTAFVLPPGEVADRQDAGTGDLRQRSHVSVQIIVVFTGIDATGVDQSGDMDAAREGIKNALLGQVVGDLADPFELSKCGTLDVDLPGASLAYTMEFSSSYYIRRP